MFWLKQSTSYTLPAGPFLDETDHRTVETTLSISQADVRILKAGGSFAQKSANTGNASHLENGWYGISLSTTDTNTLGPMVVAINESGADPVWVLCMVVSANTYDSFFGASSL